MLLDFLKVVTNWTLTVKSTNWKSTEPNSTNP